MVAQVQRRLFTVDEYRQMIDAGIFGEDDRLELLAGEIVAMGPIGSRHAACVKRLAQMLIQKLDSRAIVGVQDPIRLDAFSVPETDLSVVAFREDYYAGGHPTPDDVLLLIEVADSPIDQDRAVKLPLYARAGIAEVWLMDLIDGVIDAYRTPSSEGYLLRQRYLSSQTIETTGALAISIQVGQVLS